MFCSLLLDRRHCDVCALGFEEEVEQEDHCKKKKQKKKQTAIRKFWVGGHRLKGGHSEIDRTL